MRVLLDTHVFLWWASERGVRVSARARALLGDSSTEALVSVASAWEIAIKVAAGRLDIEGDPEQWVPDHMLRHDFAPLPVILTHALRAGRLPAIHRDPFDRLLVAQAQVERIPILSPDPAISRYDVDVIW